MIASALKGEGRKHRNWADILIMTGLIVNAIVILLLVWYHFFGR